jgi:hypothetical protein
MKVPKWGVLSLFAEQGTHITELFTTLRGVRVVWAGRKSLLESRTSESGAILSCYKLREWNTSPRISVSDGTKPKTLRIFVQYSSMSEFLPISTNNSEICACTSHLSPLL